MAHQLDDRINFFWRMDGVDDWQWGVGGGINNNDCDDYNDDDKGWVILLGVSFDRL